MDTTARAKILESTKPTESQRSQIQKLLVELTDLGMPVDLDNLVVLCTSGGGRDTFVGELLDLPEDGPGKEVVGEDKALVARMNASISGCGPVQLVNPKRYVRLEMMNPQGHMLLSYVLMHLDHMKVGVADFQPVYGYWVILAGGESQIAILSLYKELATRQSLEKRELESRIIAPNVSFLPQGPRR